MTLQTTSNSGTGVAAGDMLPGLWLEPLSGGDPIPLRRGKGPRIVLAIHSAECTGCRDYMEAITDRTGEIERWDARVLVVVPGAAEAISGVAVSSPAFEMLSDADGRLNWPGATIAIADEWGEIYFAMDAGTDHEFPSTDEVTDWLRFIAIQCPECEQPEGDWRTI
ncbi:MAG TPA: hypothetical protein VFI91_07800 [Longimicrobiaceae bacterium]|nr:hypothetical protein [Longimicrobiaceae bacterium]